MGAGRGEISCMKETVNEQKTNTRPYWKVVVSLVFSLMATFVVIFAGIKLLIFFMPFVIGWFISYIATPMVNWLEKRLRIARKLGLTILIVAVLGAVVWFMYLAGSKLVYEIVRLIQDMPALYEDAEAGMRSIGNSFNGVFHMFPEGIQQGFSTMVNNFDQTMGELIAKFSDPAVTATGNAAKKIPSILISTIVSIVSAYFFIADREKIIIWSKKIAPDPLAKRMTLVMDNLKYAVGGYFKAQFKIMAVVFVILTIGFMAVGIHFSFLLAILIAFLDFLPFFGTGTALLPWALYKFLVGNYKMALALIVLYGVTQLVRQLIQPKLVGDSVGLNPLLTLVLLYIGYRFGSVLGMIFAVPIGMIVINLFKAGAFDYILDDVKILVAGVLSLRE